MPQFYGSGALPSDFHYAKGKTPTATGWNTAPTNLGNVTDENDATVTGEGSKTGISAETNDGGEVTVDLGQNRAVTSIGAKVGIRNNGTGTVTCRGRAGLNDNLTDAQFGADVTTSSFSEVVMNIYATVNATVRYISLRVWNANSAYYAYLKVYELFCCA